MKLKVLNMNYVYNSAGQLVPTAWNDPKPWGVFGGPRLIRKYRTHHKALRYALKQARKAGKK